MALPLLVLILILSDFLVHRTAAGLTTGIDKIRANWGSGVVKVLYKYVYQNLQRWATTVHFYKPVPHF